MHPSCPLRRRTPLPGSRSRVRKQPNVTTNPASTTWRHDLTRTTQPSRQPPSPFETTTTRSSYAVDSPQMTASPPTVLRLGWVGKLRATHSTSLDQYFIHSYCYELIQSKRRKPHRARLSTMKIEERDFKNTCPRRSNKLPPAPSKTTTGCGETKRTPASLASPQNQ